MYINSRVDFPVDVGRRKTRVLNVELNSYDENSHIFEISFLDIELDDTYEVNVLSYFEESDRTAYSGTDIRDGVAVFTFNTDLISMDEKVTNYVYLKKGDYQIEVNSFRVNVNLSKIDEKAVTVAKAYDNKYDALLKDFELAIKKYRDSLPSSEEILEDVGETIRKLEELNNSFGFQEEERVNKESERVSSESIRDESERERVAHEETRMQNEQKREEDELNRKSSEDSRLVSEQERKSSEEERIISEQMRTSAEEEREVSELTRRDSEQERVENESIRAQSEQSREEGEAERVISEDARESSELERMVAEGERARGETIREVGERERVLNESIRKTAEEERVEREDARADLYELVKQRLADGEFIGEKGDTGDGLEYVWNGTQLGVRKEGDTEYVYVDLKGDKGDTGEIENFTAQHIEEALGYVPISANDVPDPTWANLQNKPSTFAPSAHTHPWSEVTGKPSTFTPSAHTHAWGEVTGKPSTFTPSTHTHGISDVTGLRAELDSIPELTKENVGLGNVDNVKQASKAEHDQLVDDFSAHRAEKVHQGEIHGFRLTDGKLEYFDGAEWQRVKGDGYPVGAVTELGAKSDNASATVTWRDPEDVTIKDSLDNIITIARWGGTKLLMKTTGYPENENDGTLVVDNGVRNQYREDGFELTGLTNDQTYYISTFPYTTEGVFGTKTDILVTPTGQRIYGVRIDKNNSNPETRVTYIGDAVGFAPMRGNNGDLQWGGWEFILDEFEINPVVLKDSEVNYYLRREDRTKKADGSNAVLTGADGDVMVEFGTPVWYKWTDVGDAYTIEVSNKHFSGAVKHGFEVEEGYNQALYYPLLTTQVFFPILFKSTDSQSALGRGRVDGTSGYANTGGTNTKGMFYGSNADEQMCFLGIEDYWGNKLWWIDGLATNANFDLLIGKGDFNDNGNGYEVHGSGVSANTAGYIDEAQGGNDKGFIIKSRSGSETTYYADYGTLTSSRVADFGGGRSYGASAGAFVLRLSYSGSSSYAYVGARLFCASDGKIYIGAYLGTVQGGKLRSVSGQEPTGSKTIGAFRTDARANN